MGVRREVFVLGLFVILLGSIAYSPTQPVYAPSPAQFIILDNNTVEDCEEVEQTTDSDGLTSNTVRLETGLDEAGIRALLTAIDSGDAVADVSLSLVNPGGNPVATGGISDITLVSVTDPDD